MRDNVTSLNNEIASKMGSLRASAAEQELWQKLETFPFDRRDAVQDFSARLAKENGWTRRYAERVRDEYRCFLFLAMVAGHPVTPSEEVDQAWHLHLVYTRSYWQELCGKVLGRPLHHEPTAGGSDEGAKFREQYARTLASYEEKFGEAAPADIWPGVEERFGPHEGRWVDVTRHWVLPRPRFLARFRPRRVAAVLSVATLGLLVAGCTDEINVLNWQGFAFLKLYAVSFVAALLASFILVSVMRGRAYRQMDPLTDPYDIAFLAGGGARVVDASLAALYARKQADISRGRKNEIFVRRQGSLHPAQHDMEHTVHHALPVMPNGLLKDVRKSLIPSIEAVRDRLSEMGLIYSPAGRRSLQWLAAMPFLLLIGLGLAKVGVGLGRDKPVVFLIIGLVFTLVVMLIRISSVRRRTPDGEAMWKKLKPQAKAYEKKSAPALAAESPVAMPMAVAFLGSAALAGTGYEPLRDALKRPDSSASGGCGSGCGTGSSGCGGGGCGGGGGGCGGCGGGGD